MVICENFRHFKEIDEFKSLQDKFSDLQTITKNKQDQARF